MNVLVIGSGGREHALVWKLKQSPQVQCIYCAPGNPGMQDTVAVGLRSLLELADFAEQNNIALTVVGPEAPLCDGIVDIFRRRGLVIFGPDQKAACLEGSKVFAKHFMRKFGIPTADFETFTDAASAKAYVHAKGIPIVIKADGLAAGKGVTVAQSVAEACEAIDNCFSGVFGDAGRTVLVEQCLQGEEASILALCDGKTIVPLASSQDHKRAGEGDTGANTGGMGAYSPAPIVTPSVWEEINTRVLNRFLAGCQAEKLDYRGVIYAGIMITESGIEVLEFNVRFGDPETQAILPRLQSDLAAVMLAVVEQRLAEFPLHWREDAAVCVVMASGGYPGKYEKGHSIQGLDEAAATGAIVFHAGTTAEDGRILTDGGRVLGVTALGATIRDAVAQSYRAVEKIRWNGAFYRRDIAHRALKEHENR